MQIVCFTVYRKMFYKTHRRGRYNCRTFSKTQSFSVVTFFYKTDINAYFYNFVNTILDLHVKNMHYSTRDITFLFISIICIIFTYYIHGISTMMYIPRSNCYKNSQPNCSKDFSAAYPELSKSATDGSDADTWFLLFTRRNKDKPEKLHKCSGRLPVISNFNSTNRLIVIPMPFLSDMCLTRIYREWVEQLLIKDDYNILVIDWSWGNRPDYRTACLNAKLVADQSVVVLGNIQADTGIENDKLHYIGHSLGAQIAGLIGAKIKPYRITGIDPAGPGYPESASKEERLDAEDAEIVDVWHCNEGDCLPYFGINYTTGHADFFINGGSEQLPCYSTALESFAKGDIFTGLLMSSIPTSCSHIQCASYFMVSINANGCQFIGVECDNKGDFEKGKCNSCGINGEKCTIMGMDWEKYTTPLKKRYYVKTKFLCPFCDNSLIDLQGFASTYYDSIGKG